MMKYKRTILTISFIFITFFAPPTWAAEKSYTYGLAMHGKAKYNEKSAHLSYVNPQAPKGGTLKMSAIGSFDNLNPFSIKGVAAEGLELGYDRLMRRVWDEPFTMYPLIAEKLKVSKDRSGVTYYINPKAKFHDGSPITAQDVLFSFETLREFGRPNMRKTYKLADKAEVINDHQISFHFTEGYNQETVMIFSMMPVLSKAWWSNRKFDETLTDIPLLNGPYKISTVDQGRKIVYERVKDYWAKDLFANKGLYNFDTVSYDYFRDDTVAIEALKKGDIALRRELDISKWENGYSDAPHVTKIAIPHQRPERAAGLVFNLRRPPFDDIRIRQALSIAFDEEWIGKNFFYGKMKPMRSFFANSSLAAPQTPSSEELSLLETQREKLKPEVFQYVGASVLNAPTAPQTSSEPLSMRSKLKRADELLRESGWIIENGKRINNSTKNPMIFELLVNTTQDERIAVTYKNTLQKLGIEIIIRKLDSSGFTERKMNYDFDMISIFWQNTLSPGTEQSVYWSCQSGQHTGGMNYSGLCNPAADYFADKVAQAKDYTELTTLTQCLDRILLSEYIMIPFFYKNEDFIVHHQGLNSPKISPIYGFVIESWWSDLNKKN